MKSTDKRLGVRLILIAAVAIGCSSATLSGRLATAAVAHPTSAA